MSRDDPRRRVLTVLFVLGVCGDLLTAQEGRREGRGGAATAAAASTRGGVDRRDLVVK
jgi:hypothetical protein